MSDKNLLLRQQTQAGSIRCSLVAFTCLLRGVPLFFGASPRTPLRVLGIIALDTLHVLHHSQPLPRKRARDLATFLDFQGCANAAWDHKHLCEGEREALRHRLEVSGLGPCLKEYLARLRELESRRPSIGGNRRSFNEARCYREGVAYLAIATAAAIALNGKCGDEDLTAAHSDPDIETLFRILMQCQIIDDVMDYPEDLAAGLPSFLTGSASLPQAMRWTARASRHYAACQDAPPRRAIFPLRAALSVVTAGTDLILRVAVRRSMNIGVQIGG